MVDFGEFLKTWSLRSNRVTRQVSFNRSKTGRKCQNKKKSNATFWVIFKHCVGFMDYFCNIFAAFFSVMVRGTMTPDTYKPIFRVSVLPIDKKADGFQMYSSQNCLHWSSGIATFLSTICLTLIFTLSNKCLFLWSFSCIQVKISNAYNTKKWRKSLKHF